MSYVTQTAMHEKTGGVEMVWCSDSLGVTLLFRAKGKVGDRQSSEKACHEGSIDNLKHDLRILFIQVLSGVKTAKGTGKMFTIYKYCKDKNAQAFSSLFARQLPLSFSRLAINT